MRLTERGGWRAACISFRPVDGLEAAKRAVRAAFEQGTIPDDQATVALIRLDLDARRLEGRIAAIDGHRRPAEPDGLSRR